MEQEKRQQLRIVIVGHVDHGKSTLVGRIFHDTDSLPDGKLEQIKATCERRGMPFEWSFLMDALQAERNQAITIDTTQIWFRTKKRDYVIIDAPGHTEFLKNMITGAASSEAAVLVIDAKEGVREQSKRHGYLLHLLGVRQIVVAVNKMDLAGYSEERFHEIEKEYREYLESVGVAAGAFIPVSGREGDNIASHSSNMKWYGGLTLLEALDAFHSTPALVDLPLRFPVQDVYKFDERRIIVGRVESGVLKVGDEVLFSPANRRVTVASIEAWGGEPPAEVSAGMSAGITLSEQIFAERGHVISHSVNSPMLVTTFLSRIFWLGNNPLEKGRRYRVKVATTEFMAEVQEIVSVIETSDLSRGARDAVGKNEVAEIKWKIRGVAALDDFSQNQRTGRFVVMDGFDIAGGGIIDLSASTDQRVAVREVKALNLFSVKAGIGRDERAHHNGHRGGVLWFTGLPGSGKSTLALELQRRLFEKGYQVYVLDGDNVRQGLCADLGFSQEERSENIRRVGEVAALFADAGFIVITAFISPFREDRWRARNAAPDSFNTIYIKAAVEECEKRDPKGLYKKARKGEITSFTGVDDPYEVPENPDLVVDTEEHSVEECVEMLVEYVRGNFTG